MVKTKIKNMSVDMMEILKQTTPLNATHGTKQKYDIDVSYWKQIEQLLKNLPTNKYLFMPKTWILQKIKSTTTIASNFGYFITEAFVNNKLRIHVGYEKINEKNLEQMQKLKTFEHEQLKINDVVAKLSYITNDDIKNKKRKSYEKLQ